jgi:hypothetical protein
MLHLQMVGSGFEPPTHGFSVRVAKSHETLQPTIDAEFTNKSESGQNKSGVKTGERKTQALSADLLRITEMHPELGQVVERWPDLPEHVRQAILCLLK